MAHTCQGQIIPELRVPIVCSYPPCTTLNATNSLTCLTIHMCNMPPRYIHTCHHPPMLQSWTKSVMNFALPYSQDTHVEDLAPQWTFPPPHTNQSCSVRHNNVSAGHALFLLPRFWDQAKIFWNLHFSRYHSIPLYFIVGILMCSITKIISL